MTPDPSYQRLGRIAFVTVAAFLAMWMLWRFLPALAWAGVLAIATWPLRERLIGLGMGRSFAAMLLTAAVALALVVPFALLGVTIAREAVVLVQAVRDWRESGIAAPDWLMQLPMIGAYASSWWRDHLA